MFHIKDSVCLWSTYIHVNITPINSTLWSLWKIPFAAFRTYVTLTLNKIAKSMFFFSFLSLFQPIFSSVYQGSHLRWWYSTPHIFHHLLITLLYSHSLPISTKDICRFFFFQLSISKAKSLLKREKGILKQHNPWSPSLTPACPSVWFLVSLTLPNLSITISHAIIYVS